MSLNHAWSVVDQSVPNIKKNPQTIKWAKKKDNPNEDVETLKESVDKVEF